MRELIVQDNAITEARYEMSELEKNIVYLLIRQLKENDLPEKEYIIDLTEIEKILGPLQEESVRAARSNLIRRTYTIKRKNGDILIASLMSVVSYDTKQKTLGVKISHKILPYFVALKENYTEFELHVALSLRHKYSKRLYEMLSQHKRQKVLNISIDELKWRLKLSGEKKKEEVYTQFSDFERQVLKIAQKEMSEYADITFDYEAKKTGRKYTDLVFKIRPVDQLSIPFPPQRG